MSRIFCQECTNPFVFQPYIHITPVHKASGFPPSDSLSRIGNSASEYDAIYGYKTFEALEKTIAKFNFTWGRNTLIYFLNICYGCQHHNFISFRTGQASEFNFKPKSAGNNKNKLDKLTTKLGWLAVKKAANPRIFNGASNIYEITVAGRGVFTYFVAQLSQ